MKYQLIGSNNYLINPIYTLLKNRGIQDIKKFLNPDKSVINHYNLLDNMETAVNCMIKHLKNNNKIFIQIDSDVDGYTSSALLVNYLNRLKNDIEIIYNIHEKKEHGIKVEEVPEDVKLVVVPDAGTNDYKEHKKLYDRGIDVIILDHHHADEGYSQYAIVVNNQLSNYPNKYLSGVGIVYKFCKALDDKLNKNIADDYLDLVALGLIADLMDTRELENRYYILKGLQNIKNPFFKALLNQQYYMIKGVVSPLTVGFYIAPLINAVIRVGTQEEKMNMFKAFLETNEMLYYERGSVKEWRPIAVEMARICVNVKSKQNRLVDKGLKAIEEKIEQKNLNKNKILIIDITDILESTLTGYAAMKLASKYGKPVLLLRKKEENIYGGSARGYDKCSIKDFRKFCLDTNLFTLAQGHDNAFGIEIIKENIIKVNEVFNDLLKDENFEKVFDVDFIIPINQLKISLIEELDKLKTIWGQNVSEPYIAITDIDVVRENIELIGKSKNTIKFKANGIDFIKFNATEEEFEKLTEGQGVTLEVVGKCSINEWQGVKSPQIIIEDYNIVNVNKFLF